MEELQVGVVWYGVPTLVRVLGVFRPGYVPGLCRVCARFVRGLFPGCTFAALLRERERWSGGGSFCTRGRWGGGRTCGRGGSMEELQVGAAAHEVCASVRVFEYFIWGLFPVPI
jgi:hypothetical protein